MNLYLIQQEVNCGYDTFDSAVVAAENEDDARSISPSFETLDYGKNKLEPCTSFYHDWVFDSDKDRVKVTFLGTTELERCCVCSSFNAG